MSVNRRIEPRGVALPSDPANRAADRPSRPRRLGGPWIHLSAVCWVALVLANSLGASSIAQSSETRPPVPNLWLEMLFEQQAAAGMGLTPVSEMSSVLVQGTNFAALTRSGILTFGHGELAGRGEKGLLTLTERLTDRVGKGPSGAAFDPAWAPLLPQSMEALLANPEVVGLKVSCDEREEARWLDKVPAVWPAADTIEIEVERRSIPHRCLWTLQGITNLNSNLRWPAWIELAIAFDPQEPPVPVWTWVFGRFQVVPDLELSQKDLIEGRIPWPNGAQRLRFDRVIDLRSPRVTSSRSAGSAPQTGLIQLSSALRQSDPSSRRFGSGLSRYWPLILGAVILAGAVSKALFRHRTGRPHRGVAPP